MADMTTDADTLNIRDDSDKLTPLPRANAQIGESHLTPYPVDYQELVRAFHVAMGHPAPDSPTFSRCREKLRLDLIKEEYREIEAALAQHDMAEVVDGIADLLYVTFGMAVELGVDMGPVFEEVQRANMSKVGGGQRADGKQLKPEGWKPPDIQSELFLQGYSPTRDMDSLARRLQSARDTIELWHAKGDSEPFALIERVRRILHDG